nr:MAG TPA: hypothetical protein [Caudoviricetes sp.]
MFINYLKIYIFIPTFWTLHIHLSFYFYYKKIISLLVVLFCRNLSKSIIF